jgi:hypothetical protein
MSEQLKEWANMWGAKVKLRNDMPDDMLRDAIETSRRVLDNVSDFEMQGLRNEIPIQLMLIEDNTRVLSSDILQMIFVLA